MAEPITMPQLGESVTEGTITRWLKARATRSSRTSP
jgi:pyruvate/2-oxoglutarate dehydrogenase complex dihydrolipoamide acyltransferase (E2) component